MTATASALRSHPLGAACLRTLRAHRWPIGLITVYLAAGFALTTVLGQPERFRLGLYNHALAIFLGTAVTLFVPGYVFYVMIKVRPAHLTAYLLSDFPVRYCQPERLLGLGLIMLVVPVFLSGVSSLKTLIPAVQPFSWDIAFAETDRVLHGGVHPWALLQPIVGHPGTTFLLNALYNVWFIVGYSFLLWQAAVHSLSAKRLQFFIAFILCWALLGTVAAMGLSSAGPVFYGRLFGVPDPYLPLMEYLHAAHAIIPVWALETQEMVWQSYQTGYQIPAGGISAMPSLHVSLAWLWALTAAQYSRKLALVYFAYAAIILVGSVHLAWHYAVDGYVSIVATTTIWWLAGVIARRELPPPEADRTAA